MEDKAIVDLYWARSERAISETDAKYGKYCRRISFNILADSADAEECVNDTYMKAWNTMPSNRPASLIHYVGKMARWISLTRLREKNSLRRGGENCRWFWMSWPPPWIPARTRRDSWKSRS